MKNTPRRMHDAAPSSSGSLLGLSALQHIYDSSPDIICAFDKEGRFLHVNAAAQAEWGYEPAELLGCKFTDHIAGADQSQASQMLEAARSHLAPLRFQAFFVCKDGSSKPMLWSFKWNAREEVLYSVARDGSELLAAAEEVKHYQHRLYRAYKLADLCWWEWNMHGDRIVVSDELYELYGISRDQCPVFSTGTFLSFVYPDDLSLVLENVALFWTTPGHQFRHRVRKPSGEIIYVELKVQTIKDENGIIIQVHGTVKDITKQQKNQEERSTTYKKELQQANQSLLVALESMSDGFCTTDSNWTITFINQRAATMLGGREKGYFTGRNLWVCFPEAVGNRFYTEYHRAAAENTFVLVEEYYPPLNTWFEVSVYPNANGLSFYIRDISRRKQQEEELRLSNERFHLVAQATNEAIWDWNIAAQKVEWGEGFCTIFGYQSDVIKRNFDFVVESIHPDDKERVLASVNTVISGTGNNWTNEFRFRKADDSYAYVVDKGFIVRDEHGNAIRMAGAIQDITDRKRQEERMIFIAKASSEMLWERDLLSEEAYVHAGKFKELFGYELAGNSLLRSFWLERVHPEDLQRVNEQMANALNHGLDFFPNEYRFQKADGSWAYIRERTFVIKDFNGKPISLLGAAEDITQQRLSEEALVESDLSYRELFNSAPLPTIIFNEETLQILDANQAIAEQYGYSREELLSKTVLDLHLKEDYQLVLNARKVVKPLQRNALGIHRHVKKNGVIMLVEVSATPIYYKGKTVMLATAFDVTEKLRLHQQLIEEKVNHQKSIMKVAIEAQEKERSEIGKELHDNVNQLMSVAKLYVENIRHIAAQKDYFIDQSIALINRSISETRRLSHALVAPAMGEAGLKESLLGLIQTFRELNVFRIDTEFEFEDVQVKTGLSLTVYRILQECFSNTLKYAKASVVSVSIGMQQGKLQVTYTDNGVGFDPATAKKGIGLKNIINRAEANGGKAKFTTSRQGGFALTLQLPLDADESFGLPLHRT